MSKLIPLTKGKTAIVDDDIFPILSQRKWHCTAAGYAARLAWNKSTKKSSCVYMHREITKCPSGLEVDHINHNKLDNRVENLRVCTHAQNGKNMALSRANKTGFKGVDKHSQNGNFRAQIMHDGKVKHLGCFATAADAGKAYATAASKLHMEFANT